MKRPYKCYEVFQYIYRCTLVVSVRVFVRKQLQITQFSYNCSWQAEYIYY
jgi:hypothetical protein